MKKAFLKYLCICALLLSGYGKVFANAQMGNTGVVSTIHSGAHHHAGVVFQHQRWVSTPSPLSNTEKSVTIEPIDPEENDYDWGSVKRNLESTHFFTVDLFGYTPLFSLPSLTGNLPVSKPFSYITSYRLCCVLQVMRI